MINALVFIGFTLLLYVIADVIYDKLVDIECVLKDIRDGRRYDK